MVGSTLRDMSCNHCDSPLPKSPFWSGVDANDPVTWGCHHRWVTVRVGDAQAHPSDPDEQMAVCARCYSPRCGHSNDLNPCLLARHHQTEHAYSNGALEPVGG